MKFRDLSKGIRAILALALALAVALSSPASAALSSTGVFQVDNGTNGNDSLNAGYFNPSQTGALVDFSITAPIPCTDLAIQATNTQVASSSIGFSSAHIGNGLRVTAGTNFTVGLYEITAVSGGIATLDRAVGTAGATGGTARVGGALASPGGAGALFTANSGQTIYIKNTGTSYTIGSGTNSAGNQLRCLGNSGAPAAVIGYQTTRTPTNTDSAPTLVPGANSLTFLVDADTNCYLINLSADNSSSGKTGCVAFGADDNSVVIGCTANAFATCFTITTIDGFGNRVTWLNCVAISPTSTGFNISGGSGHKVIGCVCLGGTGNASHFESTAAYCSFIRCISRGTPGTGDSYRGGNAGSQTYVNCVSYKPNGTAFGAGGALTTATTCINCVVVQAGQGGSGVGYAAGGILTLINCADNGSASGATSGTMIYKRGFVTLTADPFTNGAGGDFSLTNAAGGGAALRGAGWPASFPGLSTTSALDIGPAQHSASGGATGVAY